jgi:pyruvate/2-oxoacid:ferredoxin oxidoreductase alpha subunit
MLVVEMNAGQMLEDVRLAVQGRCPVEFYGRMGGVIPLPDEVLEALRMAGPAARTALRKASPDAGGPRPEIRNPKSGGGAS